MQTIHQKENTQNQLYKQKRMNKAQPQKPRTQSCCEIAVDSFAPRDLYQGTLAVEERQATERLGLRVVAEFYISIKNALLAASKAPILLV